MRGATCWARRRERTKTNELATSITVRRWTTPRDVASSLAALIEPLKAICEGRPAIACLDVRHRGRKEMLGSEPTIGYESISSRARCDVPDEIPVRAGGSEVEPAAMQVNDRRAFPRPRQPFLRAYP